MRLTTYDLEQFLPCTANQGTAVQVRGHKFHAGVETGDCCPVHVHVPGVVILFL